jgi:hypothetical protein
MTWWLSYRSLDSDEKPCEQEVRCRPNQSKHS